MAWNLHWQCCFQSLELRQFAINIYEQNYNGSVVQLQGGDNPFVTQEDNDNDIFMPIRTQTGYIRVIDHDGTLLESLIPSHNTQRLVKLYYGLYENNTFTATNLMWVGFMSSQAFTQPWDEQVKMLEFPVKSLLGALEDVYIDESVVGTDCNIAKFIVNAFDAIGENPSGCYIISNHDDVEKEFLKKIIDPQVFFTTSRINNENTSYMEWIGNSFYDVLSSILNLYGLMLRENQGRLYIVMYDNGDGKIGVLQMPQWSQMVLVANGGTYGGSMLAVYEYELMDYAEFAGNDNVAGFIQGGKNACVKLAISENKFNIELPITDETPDAPIEFALHQGKLFVQPHTPRTQLDESFFYDYTRRTLNGQSDYNSMLAATVIKGYTFDPYAVPVNLITGTFPCRWFRQKDAETVVLKNGIYLNTQYKYQNDPISYNQCYKVRSLVSFKADTGWLNIQFNWHDLIHYDGAGGTPWLFDDASSVMGYDIESEIHMCLQVGNKFWNGSSWVTGSAPSTDFWFRAVNGQVPDNKTPDMNTDVEKGFFIPITEELSGFVTFYVLNGVFVNRAGQASTQVDCYSHILDGLEITHVLPLSITSSERSQNTYRKLITDGGFSDDKEIDVSIGTINNNYPSPCFVKDSNNNYIESLKYYYEGGIIKSERPEMNLLNRIVAHYNVIRRTFTAILKINMGTGVGLDFFKYRYTYLGKIFFGIDVQHNWRDDKQEVKFIEVT